MSSSSLCSHVPLAHEGLEIRAELHSVRRVHVDHLHLPAHALVVQQRVHHHQGVAQDHPVHPLVPILVGSQDLVANAVLGIAEQARTCPSVRAAVFAVRFESLDDRLGREPLMDEQRQSGNIERQPLRLAGPVEERLVEPFQLVHGVAQAADGRHHLPVPPLQLLGRVEFVRRRQRGGLLDECEEPFTGTPGPGSGRPSPERARATNRSGTSRAASSS